MDDEIKLLFEKALSTLESARKNIEINEYSTSINRSYYAAYYIASALLLKKGIKSKKHSGTIQQFSLHFVQNDSFSIESFKFFTKLWKISDFSMLENQRFSKLEEDGIHADYNLFSHYTKKKAKKDLENAKKFIEECEKFL